MNLKLIIRILGFLIFGEGIALLLSLIVSLIYGEPDLPAFLITSGITLTTGGLLLLLTKKAVKDIGKREGFIIVSFSWIIFSFFGSLPYIISGAIPNFTEAFFETISGFTTTGASVLTDIEALPHGILFWRSFTQWLGGIGIIVLLLAVLPVFGIGGMYLFMAESTSDKISSKIRQTAKILWLIYVFFTIIETILLRIGGMTLFDSINHSFTTMATGGFSTKQASIAYWDSAFIQYTITVFMFLGGANFTLFYAFLLKRKLTPMLQDEELKYYTLFIIIFTVFVFAGLLITTPTGIDPEKTFRSSLFQVVSIITTTGFATVDYLSWTTILTTLIFALFFFGGCTGSTSGGIKIARIVLLLKNSYYELQRMIHPSAIIPVKFNRHAVDTKIITHILAFFIFYIFIFAAGAAIFTLFVPNLETSMGAVASALGNIGPGLGAVGPAGNYAHIAPAGLWFLSLLMLLGRLELFTVIVLISPTFWKN